MSNNRSVRVAAVQMESKLGEVAGNLETILARHDEATEGGARLVVFPECALTGYCFGSRQEAFSVAEPIPGPSLTQIAVACAMRRAYAIVGLLERDGGRVYNACALVGPGGVIGSYRKVHLPFIGVDRFTDPGDRPFQVHDAGGLKVGMHICYDGSFPECARVMALQGADLIVLPTNWPSGTEAQAEHIIPCRAHENVVYAMAVNRVGEERTFRFIGRSSIAGPDGQVLARSAGDAEEILYADIDPVRARQKKIVRRPGEHEINRIADRRPGFYTAISEIPPR